VTPRPEVHRDPETVVDRILADTGADVALGLPLGIGKATHVANALFERARADRGIRLRIFTALTLTPPDASGELGRRFVEPLNARLFAGCPRLAYAEAMRGEGLPPNVQVNQFFLQAGRWLGNSEAQQNYTSANYTHAARFLLDQGVNVMAQLVAADATGDGARYSVSSNSDITLDILDAFRSRGGDCLLVGQVNGELPFMPGPAALPGDTFDHVLTGPGVDFPLFGAPNRPVSDADHAIAIRTAALVPDGGSLQIGIGSIGDAIGAALIMRHRAPALFRATLERLGDPEPALRNTAPFEAGIYGISEMFVPALLELYRAGVLRRPAADGALLHAGFFLGPRSFYAELRAMPEAERAQFQMRGISFVNALYGDEAARRRDRRGGRFVNNAMLVTALGAVTSDALADGRVVSGVGGQYNFVAQAFALDDARSVIVLPATRSRRGAVTSNVVWSYGHTTIPRHLRDIVVTEYGVAELRGRSDRDCVAAMLGVTDARFRDGLLREAGRAGKIEPGFRPRGPSRRNLPEHVRDALAPAREAGWCRRFPFGTDFTETEQRLMPALARLESALRTPRDLARLAASVFDGAGADEAPALRRLGLEAPTGLRERAYRRAVLWALRQSEGSG
jgi:hypothetical protein